MSDPARGVLAIVAACVIWGLSSIYYKLLSHVPAPEVLAHRTLWSLVFFGFVLSVQGRLGQVWGLVRSHRVGWVVLAALAISFNWFLFISAVQTGKAMQASLGYYIFPLVAVVFGVLFRGERLTPVQWLAVGLAALAVLGLTLGLGVVPVISLALALSFGAYGLLKGRVEAGPVLSVTGEVLLLTPLALIWLWAGPAETFGQDWRDSLLLVCSGPLTATPLILFSYAARRISYASVGLIQYINPTLQFLVATFVFGEIFTQWHGLAFGGIWTALALYSVSALRQERALRRAASSASTVGITRM